MSWRSIGPTALKQTVRTNALRKGLLGGSRQWLVVFAALRVASWSNKVTKRGEAPIAFRQALQPGQAFVITHLEAPAKAPKSKGASPA
ncbi:MAG TPA: hypothetical protein DCE75_09695 [Acidimicrobiaceae bacterium]|jgi:hypothetical protein|nr:hypothetical protein [Acidimicrobiaceae bacterium]|tara:strand:+ start:230 stop:493 length:264 start_codon:yes stop_codon:yes gene_type:complete